MISVVILSVFLPQLRRKDPATSLFEILLLPQCSYMYIYPGNSNFHFGVR